MKRALERGREMRKQWNLPLAAALAACLLACLAGCGAAPETAGRPEPVWAPSPEERGGLQSARVEAAARPLSEEEILAAYEQAETFYAWFELSPLPSGGATAVADGVLYRQVDREDMETLEDLRTTLRSVFSQEVTERLLTAGGDVPRYRDIDGVLCVTGTGRDREPDKGEVRTQVEQTGGSGYAVNVTVDLLDEDGVVTGLEHWSFPYMFVDDRWVFTDFRLVY